MTPAAHRADTRRGRIEDGPAAVVDADHAPPARDQPPRPGPHLSCVNRYPRSPLPPEPPLPRSGGRTSSQKIQTRTIRPSTEATDTMVMSLPPPHGSTILPVEDIANRWCHHPQELLVSSLATLGMQTMGAAVLGTLPQRLWQHARAEPQAGRARRARAAPPASTGDEHAVPGNLQAQGAHRRRPKQRGTDATSKAHPPSSPHALPETRSERSAPRCRRPRSGWYRPRRHARPLGNGLATLHGTPTRRTVSRRAFGSVPNLERRHCWREGSRQVLTRCNHLAFFLEGLGLEDLGLVTELVLQV